MPLACRSAIEIFCWAWYMITTEFDLIVTFPPGLLERLVVSIVLDCERETDI